MATNSKYIWRNKITAKSCSFFHSHNFPYSHGWEFLFSAVCWLLSSGTLAHFQSKWFQPDGLYQPHHLSLLLVKPQLKIITWKFRTFCALCHFSWTIPFYVRLFSLIPHKSVAPFIQQRLLLLLFCLSVLKSKRLITRNIVCTGIAWNSFPRLWNHSI